MSHAETLKWQSKVRPYRRNLGEPLTRPLKVLTLDTGTLKADGGVAVIHAPWEPLTPGPRGRLFEVDCNDGEEQNAAADLDDPRILVRGGLDPSPSDPRFHQQMVYAICSKVYAQFQHALGRSIAWGFDPGNRGGRLLLRPHVAEAGANAMYDKERGEIRFGYCPAPPQGQGRSAPNGLVFTCLSHDVVAHEFTHAMLDGLRSHFVIPTSNDVLGFHEGFADLIALFEHFTYPELLESQMRLCDGDLDHAAVLLAIAQQFGLMVQGKPLRLALSEKPIRYHAGMEAHEMGEVLIGAIFTAFRRVFRRKTEPYLRLAYRPPSGYMVSELAEFLAAKASELAGQFLNMCIRAIDYCPPVDIQLGEYLRALVTADSVLVEDDKWGYREEIIAAFGDYGIYPPGVGHLSEDSLLWRAPNVPVEPVQALHFANLRFAGDPSLPASEDELIRQAEALWNFITRPHVIDEFGLATENEAEGIKECCVESIRTSRRISPDGQVLFDLVAEVTQRRTVVDPETNLEAKFFGGSTIIIGPEGEIRFVISKNIKNQGRLDSQLAYQRRAPQFWEQAGGKYKMRGYAHALAHQNKDCGAA